MEQTATVFDIGHFRNEDGPGIRTIVFFKGCPLRCQWCSNPFGLSKHPQLAVNPDRCTGCGACVTACPKDCNRMVPGEEGPVVSTDFSDCTTCGACVPVCPAGCRMISGKQYTARELFQAAYKDVAFYRKNSGGVTLSGGEVLMQYEVASQVLRLCKSNYVHTCIETSGFAKWEHFQQVAQYCNVVFVDLKHMNSAEHKQMTGVPNELILENIRKLCAFSIKRDLRVIIRRPIIPGRTSADDELEAMARFVATLPGEPELNLLPYHNMGEKKYEMIGEEYTMEHGEIMRHTDPLILRAQEICQRLAPHVHVSIGGGEIRTDG